MRAVAGDPAPARVVNVGSLGQVPFVPEEAEFEAGEFRAQLREVTDRMLDAA